METKLDRCTGMNSSCVNSSSDFFLNNSLFIHILKDATTATEVVETSLTVQTLLNRHRCPGEPCLKKKKNQCEGHKVRFVAY